MWDLARGLISFDDLNGIRNALHLFSDRERFPNVKVVNVSVTFRKMDENPRSAWQDVKVHFVLMDDFPKIICELQLCLKAFTDARRQLGGHDAYSKFRMIMEAERYVKHKLGR